MNSESETKINSKKRHFFKHLSTISQTYSLHWYDAMKYCGMSFKAAFFFFIHAFWPDCFVTNGSNTIFKLNDIIVEKYKIFNENLESKNISEQNKDEIEVEVNL